MTTRLIHAHALPKTSWLCALLLFLAVGSVARGQFVYTTNSGGITITGYTGPGGAVIIPSEIDGLPVTAIASKAFASNETITSIAIPESVSDIGPQAFSNCTALSDVTLPQATDSIPFGAFSNCGSLRNIVFPSGVTNIGDYAFTFCGLTNLHLPSGLLSVGNVAFGNCTNLVRVLFPESLLSIGTYAFSACTDFRSAYFEGDRPTVGFEAFVNDSRLTIYYLAGSSGWTPSVAGRPATLWNPIIVTNDGKLGLSADQFGFSINAGDGLLVIVEVTPTLSNPNWTPIATNTIAGSTWFFQTPASLNPTAFFRLRAP